MVVISMAIIIPSSSIYEIQNPKINDNVIERVEVGAVEVVPNNEYDTSVYNEKIMYSEQNNSAYNWDAKILNKFEKGGNTSWAYKYLYGVIYSRITGIYYSGEVVIPKLKNNYLITKINTGATKEGEKTIPQVKYSASCNLYKGSTTVTVEHNGVDLDTRFFDKTDFDFQGATVNSEFNNLQGSSLLPTELLSNVPLNVTQEGMNISGALELGYIDTKTNLNSLSVTETDENYTFNFTVLCGAKIENATYSHLSDGELDGSNGKEIEGGEIELNSENSLYYEPSYIEITVYGNTIGIDLKDKTVFIPESDTKSKKVLSIEGNELIQTSNDYSVPLKQYDNLLTEYQKGKETAVIRCSINDYYEEDGTQKICLSQYTNLIAEINSPLDTSAVGGITAKVNTDGTIVLNGTANASQYIRLISNIPIEKGTYYLSGVDEYGGLGKYFLQTKKYLNNVSKGTFRDFGKGVVVEIDQDNMTYNVELYCGKGQTFDNTVFKPMLTKGSTPKAFLPKGKNSPMTFTEGDEVIPMKYGADGEDYYMSTKADGSPKVFKVLGTEKKYDGAVFQILTLQEK